MTTETINWRDCDTLEELLAALEVLRDDAADHPSTVYLRSGVYGDGISLTLQEETLSDGSVVKNILVGESSAFRRSARS